MTGSSLADPTWVQVARAGAIWFRVKVILAAPSIPEGFCQLLVPVLSRVRLVPPLRRPAGRLVRRPASGVMSAPVHT